MKKNGYSNTIVITPKKKPPKCLSTLEGIYEFKLHNRILLNHKNVQNAHTCTNKDEFHELC